MYLIALQQNWPKTFEENLVDDERNANCGRLVRTQKQTVATAQFFLYTWVFPY